MIPFLTSQQYKPEAPASESLTAWYSLAGASGLYEDGITLEEDEL